VYKLSLGEKIFQILNYLVLFSLALVFLVPFLAVIGTSFASASELAQRAPYVLFPHRPVLYTYRVIFGHGSIIYNAYKQTFLRVGIGTLLDLAFTFPLAYVLAKRDLYGRNAITTFIFITMLFSGGLVPNFILVEKLGLLDSVWALILPGLINPWWMLIMRNFIMALPYELQEAAIVDGATAPQILLKIILPLSKPIIATVGLWYAVAHWNAWFDALIYIFDAKKMPLQPILRAILIQGAGTYVEYGDFSQQALEDALIEAPPAESLRSAMIIVSTLPILLVYPFIQKYFVKGVIVGSLKG